MEQSRWQVRNLRWWNLPIPLYTKGGADGVWKRVGYVWNQKVYAINNVTLGWIAFVEDQVPEKLDKYSCVRCGMLQPGVDIDSKLLAEWFEKTEWIQEEYSQGKLRHLNVLGLHRAEVLHAEITYWRKVAESLAGDLAQSKKLRRIQPKECGHDT